MTGHSRKPTPTEGVARAMLQKPLRESQCRNIIGTIALNRAASEKPLAALCFDADFLVAAPFLCCNWLECCAPPRFNMPWPCHCCGHDCCCSCCPGLPKGLGWQAALAAGFIDLIDEATQLTVTTFRATLRQPPSPEAVPRHIVCGVEILKAFSASGWLERANAALQPHGLSVSVFCWEDLMHAKNGDLRSLRAALQFYQGPPPTSGGMTAAGGAPASLATAPAQLVLR